MRVLVTGHDGYIGDALVPLLQGAGHDVVGLDSCLFGDCGLGERGFEIPEHAHRRARRRGSAARRLRGGDPPGGGLQRPGRRPQPRGHLRDQPRGLGQAGEGRQGRRRLAVPLLVLLQPLRGRRRRSGRRGGAVQPGDPVRALQGPRRARHRRPRRRRVQPDLPSQRDRLRPVVPPPRRPGRQQPRRPRRRPRARCGCSATAARGARWSTSRTSRAPSSPRSTPTASGFTTRPSTSGATRRTTAIREVAEIVHGLAPESTISIAPDAGPDRRSYRVSFDKVARAAARTSSRAGRSAPAPQQMLDALRRHEITADEFHSPRFHRIAQIKRLIERGPTGPEPALGVPRSLRRRADDGRPWRDNRAGHRRAGIHRLLAHRAVARRRRAVVAPRPRPSSPRSRFRREGIAARCRLIRRRRHRPARRSCGPSPSTG